MTRTITVSKLTKAAMQAKDAIDAATDQEGLERAYQALGRFSATAVRAPFSVQDQADQPGIPVLQGLLQEIHAATVRIALEAEKSRMGLAS